MFMSVEASRLQHKEALRSGILEAARAIFVRDGFDGFSMRTLARSVGYSPAAIYLHFKNKDELFDVLVEESFADLYKSLQKIVREKGKDPVQQLKRGLRLYVDWGLKNPNEYQIAFVLRTPATKPYETHQAFEGARTLMKLALAGTGTTAQESELRTQAVWAAVHGITSLLTQRPRFPWASKKRLVDHVIDSAIRGAIGAEAGKKRKSCKQ